MKQNTRLVASIALGMTLGFGARFLTGDDAVAASEFNDGTGTEAAVEEGWTMPGITVVARIPAKSNAPFVLASAAEAESWTMPGITVVARIPTKSNAPFVLASAAEAESWTMPGITVVAQVPVKSDASFALASAAEATPAVHADETTADAEWTMPGITVVAQVPTKADRAFALGGPAFRTDRPAPARMRPSRIVNPGAVFRDERRFDVGRFDGRRIDNQQVEERVSQI